MFGASCTKQKTCKYTHGQPEAVTGSPQGRSIEICKFDLLCTRVTCHFSHSPGWDLASAEASAIDGWLFFISSVEYNLIFDHSHLKISLSVSAVSAPWIYISCFNLVYYAQNPFFLRDRCQIFCCLTPIYDSAMLFSNPACCTIYIWSWLYC